MTAPRPTDAGRIDRNIDLAFDLLADLLDEPEQVAAIPPGVTIALLPDDDAEQARYNLDLALAAVARGEDVYIRHVRRTPATIVTA
jgi:hypothetical protein